MCSSDLHPIAPRLSDRIFNAAQAEGIEIARGGTYLCIEGPQFSSYAESLSYKASEFDVIGMTAMPEAKLAREAGQMSYRSELEFHRRFHRKPQGEEDPMRGGRYMIESYLQHHGDKLVGRLWPADGPALVAPSLTHALVNLARGELVRAC